MHATIIIPLLFPISHSFTLLIAKIEIIIETNKKTGKNMLNYLHFTFY